MYFIEDEGIFFFSFYGQVNADPLQPSDVQRSAYIIGMTAVIIGGLACGVKIVSRCVTTHSCYY